MRRDAAMAPAAVDRGRRDLGAAEVDADAEARLRGRRSAIRAIPVNLSSTAPDCRNTESDATAPTLTAC